jgi:hypothetical protein
MKYRQIVIGLIGLSLMLLACTLVGPATPPGTAPAQPGTSPEATLPPLAPGTLNPTRRLPTPTLAIVATPSATPTVSATATVTPTITPPPPVSAGPLDFVVGIVGCWPDPVRDGGVILTIRIDATGGNGVYTYFHENQRTTRTFKRPATKGTAVIDSYRVESGDGQRVEKKERFTGAQFGCP